MHNFKYVTKYKMHVYDWLYGQSLTKVNNSENTGTESEQYIKDAF